VCEEHRNQDDGDEIVDHGKGEQKNSDVRGKSTPDQGNQAERERDVSRNGDRPSAREVGTRDEQVYERGEGDPGCRGDGRCECSSRRIQFPAGELVAKLHGDNKKEQGE